MSSCGDNDLASTVEVAYTPGRTYFVVVGSTAADDSFPLSLDLSRLEL